LQPTKKLRNSPILNGPLQEKKKLAHTGRPQPALIIPANRRIVKIGDFNKIADKEVVMSPYDELSAELETFFSDNTRPYKSAGRTHRRHGEPLFQNKILKF